MPASDSGASCHILYNRAEGRRGTPVLPRGHGLPHLQDADSRMTASTAQPLVFHPHRSEGGLAACLARAVSGDVLFDAGSARPLRHRRVDLPDRARRRARPEDAGRRARRDRHLPRAEGSCPGAGGRQLAMRADGRRRARDRLQQAPRPHRRVRPRRDDGRGGAGRRARSAERIAQAARRVVSGRRQHVGAGDAGRHGRQQLLRLALDRLRQHGAQRAGDRGDPVRRHRGALRSRERDGGRPAARGGARARTAGDRRARARRDRAQRAQGAAPRRRLQHRSVLPAERAAVHRRWPSQLRASPRRQRRHARLDPGAHAAARAAARASHARRRQFPHAVSGDGMRAPPGRAPTRGSRARRPDDGRPCPRQSGVPAGDRARARRRARRDPSRRVHRRDARRGGPPARGSRRR